MQQVQPERRFHVECGPLYNITVYCYTVSATFSGVCDRRSFVMLRVCNLADGGFVRPQPIPPHKLGHTNPQCPTNACTRLQGQINGLQQQQSARRLRALPWRAVGCLEGWRLRPPCHRTFCKGPFVPPVGRECRATFASAWLRVTPLLSCLAWVWLCTHPGLAAPVCLSSRSYHPSLPLSAAFLHPAPTGDRAGGCPAGPRPSPPRSGSP